MPRAVLRCAALIVLLASVPALGEGGDADLATVLRAWQSAGLPLLWSSALVRPGQHLQDALPEPGRPLDPARLAAALGALGLTLEPRGSSWVVVRAAPAPAVATTPGPGLRAAPDGAPIAGTRVAVRTDAGTQQVRTDDRGRLPAGLVLRPGTRLDVDGFETLTLLAPPAQGAQLLLTPVPRIEELVVSASRYRLERTDPDLQRLDAATLDTLPVLGEDALRAATLLPAAATRGLSARPSVRGGAPDETLVLFDGVPLLQPFHLAEFQGPFGILDPRLVDHLDFHAGGFPARWGTRLSAVIDAQPRPPGRARELSLSPFEAGALVAGRGARADWTLSARRTLLDQVLEELDPDRGRPVYYDLYSSVGHDTDAGGRLALSWLTSSDEVDLNRRDGSERLLTDVHQNQLWLRWDAVWSDALSSSTWLSAVIAERRRAGSVDKPGNAVGSLRDRRRQRILAVEQHWDWQPAADWQVDWGGRLEETRAGFDVQATATRGVIATALGTAPQVALDLSTRRTGTRSALFASLRYSPDPNWVVQAGLRMDHQDWLDAGPARQWSPRLNLSWTPLDGTELRLALATTTQARAVGELQAADGVLRYESPQRSTELILDLEQQLTPTLALRAELWARRQPRVASRWENLFDPLATLPELQADRVLVQPSAAEAHGLETTLTWTPGPNLSLWGSFGASRTRERLTGSTARGWRPRNWDRPLALGLGGRWTAGPWSLTGRAEIDAAWPTTRLDAGAGGLVVGVRNGERDEDFQTLDLRLARSFTPAIGSSLELSAEVTNALLHDNSAGVDYRVDPATGTLRARPRKLLPLLPSISLQWRF